MSDDLREVLFAERQAREQLERDRSGAEYVLAGVMDALEGKAVSEFAESFGPVRAVQDLRQAREQAEQERDRLREALKDASRTLKGCMSACAEKQAIGVQSKPCLVCRIAAALSPQDGPR